MLIWKHQHIKNASGKQMNILLKPSPKILTHTKKDEKPLGQRLKAESLCTTPMFLPRHEPLISS